MDFEEALRQAARAQEQSQRTKAEKEREVEARQRQAATLLNKLGQDVLSTCRSRNLPRVGVATFKEIGSFYFVNNIYWFRLVKRVWRFGAYEVDDHGKLYLGSSDLRPYIPGGMEPVARSFERDRVKAMKRFEVINLVEEGRLLRIVPDVNRGTDYLSERVALGLDGQLYREGLDEPLIESLAQSLTQSH